MAGGQEVGSTTVEHMRRLAAQGWRDRATSLEKQNGCLLVFQPGFEETKEKSRQNLQCVRFGAQTFGRPLDCGHQQSSSDPKWRLSKIPVQIRGPSRDGYTRCKTTTPAREMEYRA